MKQSERAKGIADLYQMRLTDLYTLLIDAVYNSLNDEAKKLVDSDKEVRERVLTEKHFSKATKSPYQERVIR